MKKSVFLVDDSAMMRVITKKIFAKDPNIQIVGVAGNGQEALDKLSSINPDLILLDIEMPVMDGLEFLPHAKLRTKAKIVILSSIAIAGSSAAIKARELGADAVINKPSGAVSLDLQEKTGEELKNVVYRLLHLQ